jgi:ATP-dependent Clp protease adaptor protein ClpS
MKTETSCEELVQEVVAANKDLIIYNDDFNTFDHVIDSLVKVCEHSPIQAEQCTWIIHNNGKCQVKRGSYEALESMCTALHDRGLSATIE